MERSRRSVISNLAIRIWPNDRPYQDLLTFNLIGACEPVSAYIGNIDRTVPAAATERAVFSRPNEEGSVAFVEQSSVRNHLLTALPSEVLAALLPHLRRVALPIREIHHRPNEMISSVLFPEQGYVSLLATLEDGDAAEVGLVGREGILGIALVLGADRSPLESL